MRDDGQHKKHPEVYVIVLPAFGITSVLISGELKGCITNVQIMAIAMMSIGSISMVVYGHHMFTAGLDEDMRLFFTIATYMIAVPTGVKYFTWISSLSLSATRNTITVHSVLGFLCYFLVGGLTGVILANTTVDKSLHDTYYVVAHFHTIMAVAITYSIAGYIVIELAML